jgi:phage-related tail protein
MAEKKRLDKDQLKEKLEPVNEAVAKASQTVKDAAEKAAPAVKAAAEKAAPAVKAAGKTIRETGKKAATAGKKAASAGKKAATAILPEVYLQWQGRETLCSELVERAKADFRAENKNAVILSCRVYLKPEDGAAYYVINDKEGKIAL